MLFKIQFSLQIPSVLERVTVPVTHHPPPASVSTDPPKVFAMADDATILTEMSFDSLNFICGVLEDFGNISGLLCNKEKTVLMQVGRRTPISDDIRQLGFLIKDSITLLGADISSDSGKFENSEKRVLNKIRGEITYWSRLNLTLPGRINIAKTMLYSQLNYLGCILNFTDVFIDTCSTLITNFVKGKLNIASDRFFKHPSEGGIGLFEIRSFLTAQKSNWIKKAQKLDDHWKLRIYSKSYGNIFNLRSIGFDIESDPIITGIVKAYEIVLFEHSAKNIKKTYIYENPHFTIGHGLNKKTLGFDFFGADTVRINEGKIEKLTVEDLIENGRIRDVDDFFMRTNILLPENKLRAALFCIQSKVQQADVEAAEQMAPRHKSYIMEFYNRVKKGSKHIRKLLYGQVIPSISRNIQVFAGITDTVLNSNDSVTLNNVWTYNFFDNNMRTFLFKLYNNQLGLNSRVAHFVVGHSPLCTFCVIGGVNDIENETCPHLFYDCTYTENIISGISTWLRLNDLNPQINLTRSFFFGVPKIEGDKKKSDALFLICKLLMKFIWDCKLRVTLPTLNDAKIVILMDIDTICKLCRQWNNVIIESGLNLRRE